VLTIGLALGLLPGADNITNSGSQFEIEVIGGDNIEVRINGEPDQRYKIEVRSGSSGDFDVVVNEETTGNDSPVTIDVVSGEYNVRVFPTGSAGAAKSETVVVNETTATATPTEEPSTGNVTVTPANQTATAVTPTPTNESVVAGSTPTA